MSLPGGDAVCCGYHVWSERRPEECIRCGFVALEEIRPAVRPASSEETR